MKSESRKTELILKTALDVFLDRGYAATSLNAIKKHGGDITADLHHHYKTKPDLAFALWATAVDGWREEVRNTPQSPSAEDTIKASVKGLLKWGDKNLRLYRFFEELKSRAHFDPDLSRIMRQINEVHMQGEALYATWRVLGEVKDMPWSIASALIVGPSYAFLSTEETVRPRDRDMLVAAAWDAVRRR